MPHLSPMSWIMMLLMLWLMILIFSSTSWWLSSSSFSVYSPKKNMHLVKPWHW